MENLVFFVIPALFVYICLIIHFSRKGNLGLMSMYLQSSYDNGDYIAEVDFSKMETIASGSSLPKIIREKRVIEREPAMVG